jgi:mannose/fructose-specific phosphotransferase system component IIA
MFGGTPANATALLAQQMEGIQAVTGVSLAMLLETFMARMKVDEVETLVQTAVSAGQAGIVNVVQAFNEFRAANKE